MPASGAPLASGSNRGVFMLRVELALLALIYPVLGFAQVPILQIPQSQSFSYEDADWNIEPASRPKPPPHGAPTPRTIPGARVIKTLDLKNLLDTNKTIVVIDVLDSKER